MFAIAVMAGELDIPMNKRVKNLPSGCCVWCSIENLGHVHNIKALDGITQRRHNQHETIIQVQNIEWIEPHGWVQVIRNFKRGDAPATPTMVRQELTSLNVKFKVQDEYSKDTKILFDSINSNIGCAVAFKDWPGIGDYHMVTLTYLDDKKCVFIENRGECVRYEGTREWFNAHWSGFTVVIYPDIETLPMPRQKK